jgi:predicted small secreted protein
LFHEPCLSKPQCPSFSVEIYFSHFDVQFTNPPHRQIFRGGDGYQENSRMTKSFRLAFTLAALIGMAPALSACHTTAGVGQDLSQGGHALSNSANANAPSNPSP